MKYRNLFIFPIQKPTSCCLSIRQADRHCIWKTTSTKNAMKFYRVKLHPANSVPTTDCAMIIFIPGNSQIPLSADTFYSRIK